MQCGKCQQMYDQRVVQLSPAGIWVCNGCAAQSASQARANAPREDYGRGLKMAGTGAALLGAGWFIRSLLAENASVTVGAIILGVGLVLGFILFIIGMLVAGRAK